MKNKVLLKLVIAAVAFTLNSVPLFSQDTVKIMSYNLLNYHGSVRKDTNFRKSMKYSDPDILVVEEILSEAAMNRMLNEIMNYYTPNDYSQGTFINGFDTDNAVFFKTTEFTFLSNTPIQTDVRTINLFTLIHNLSGDTVRLFAVHLKASSGTTNEQQRLVEVNYLRQVTNTYASGTEFMVLGDFNIYGTTEPAYQKLIEVQANNQGQFVDPYNLPGTWNQASYAPYHSQSTRTTSLGDSGATGGLDDRFDFILNSVGVTEEGRIKYIPGSLRSLGNDGNHYNQGINQQPNSAVPDSIASALYYGSDHLPVYALYKFDSHKISVNNITEIAPADFELYQNYPNPFNPVTNLEFGIPKSGLVTLKIYDIQGKEVVTLVNAALNPGTYNYNFNASGLTSGIYFYKLSVNTSSITKSMTLVK
ncbi:MAG: T9SS type A sorting domain-containing protein [Bacteroidota bacterium]|nr:T9SS type A sorting domain-containing protein [Bacteroidota bacterium]